MTFVMGIMTIAVIYMYRVIDSLHSEQQAMREEARAMRQAFAQLAAAPPARPEDARVGSSAPPHGVERSGVEFLAAQPLPPEVTAAAAQQREEERAKAEALEEVRALRRSRQHAGANGGEERAGLASAEEEEARRLAAMYTVGTTAGVGCFAIADQAVVNIDVSGANCGGGPCRDCFVTPTLGMSQNTQLTIQECSDAKWVTRNSGANEVARSGIWVYTFVNMDAVYSLQVRDPTTTNPGEYAMVPPLSFIQAYCQSNLWSGQEHRLAFASTQLRTLTVDKDITLESGNFDASAASGTFTTSTGTNTLSGNTVITGAKTFTSGTGAVSLLGDTTLADGKNLQVGATAGSGGTSTFHGAVTVGDNSNNNAKDFTVYGNVAFNDDLLGSVNKKTFTTATGAVTLNGAVTVAAGKDLTMASGTGAFTTGTGDVQLKGDTTVNGAKTFTSGTGAVKLEGDTTIAASKTFTVGTAGSGGASIMYGTLEIGTTTTGQGGSLTVNGPVDLVDVTGAASTFSTGTGDVLLNGDTTIAANKDLHMASGTGTFSSASGTVTLNAHTTISGTNRFTTGTGTVHIKGSPVNIEAQTSSGTTIVNIGTAVENYNANAFSSNTVGNPIVKINGELHVGGSGQRESTVMKLYGHFDQIDEDTGGTPQSSTFSTGTGAVSLNGEVGIAAGKDITMASGGGKFTSGTGVISLQGATTFTSSATFNAGATIATGQTFTLNGADVTCTNPGGSTDNKYCMIP